jgi:hypothetical protein
MRIVRAIAGFLLGYAWVVLITTVGFGLLHPYKPYHRAGWVVALAATAVAVVAGLSGGALGSWIGRHRLVGALIAVPLIAESTWLLFFRPVEQGAFAFELVGAVVLIGSTIAGALISSPKEPRRAGL